MSTLILRLSGTVIDLLQASGIAKPSYVSRMLSETEHDGKELEDSIDSQYYEELIRTNAVTIFGGECLLSSCLKVQLSELMHLSAGFDNVSGGYTHHESN
jgi:hypothetical protein